MALSYNGVPFSFVLTRLISNAPGRDDSGSDQLYTDITLLVDGLVNADLPGISGLNAGDALARLRHLLTVPRRPLYYDLTSLPGQTGPAPVIDLPDGRDDAGGPWPDRDAFTARYVTPQTIVVSWAVNVKLRGCGGDTAAEPLSLRWDDALSFDKYFKATIRRSGTCIISSRSTDRIDQVRRTKIAPSVPPGFARTSSSYTISRDGLRCDFSFNDEQLRYAPPYPAADMTIRQSETTAKSGIGMRTGEVYVTMKGVQNANPVELQKWALTVAAARVFSAGRSDSPNVLGQVMFQCTEPSHEAPECAVSIQYKINLTPDRELLSALPIRTWTARAPGSVVNSGVLPTLEGNNRAAAGATYPWVGFGTTPPSPTNPKGYATWANPSGEINMPADGVGLAESVKLFAALLKDPCGSAMDTTPFATNINTLHTNVDVPAYNTPAGGQGGTPATNTATLSATLTSLAYNPLAAVQPTDQNGFYKWDGKPAPYEHWQCLNEYVEDPGAMVLPTCDPDGKNVEVDPSSEMWTLVKRWAASRTGAPPQLPPRVHPDPNWVLTGSGISLREKMVGDDGVSEHYEVQGWYEYQALDPALVKLVTEDVPFLSELATRNMTTWGDDAVFAQILQGVGGGNSDGGGGGGLPPLR